MCRSVEKLLTGIPIQSTTPGESGHGKFSSMSFPRLLSRRDCKKLLQLAHPIALTLFKSSQLCMKLCMEEQNTAGSKGRGGRRLKACIIWVDCCK